VPPIRANMWQEEERNEEEAQRKFGVGCNEILRPEMSFRECAKGKVMASEYYQYFDNRHLVPSHHIVQQSIFIHSSVIFLL
jgi:hypothetical protein